MIRLLYAAASSLPCYPDGVLSTLRDALAPLPVRLRWRWAALVPLHVALALAEVIGAAVLVGLFSSLTSSVPTGRLARFVSLFAPHTDIVILFAGLVAAVFLAKNMLAALAMWEHGRLVTTSMSAAFERLIGADLAAPVAQHFATGPAARIWRATHGISVTYRLVLSGLTGIVAEGLVAVALVAAVAAAAPPAALVLPVLLVSGVAVILVSTRRATAACGRESHLASERVLAWIERMLGAIRSIRANRSEAAFAAGAARAQREAMYPFRRLLVILPMPRLIVETGFVFIALALMVWVRTTVSDGAVLPVMALFAYAGFRLVPCANRLILNVDQVRQGSFAAHEVAAAISAPCPEPVAEVPLERELALRNATYLHPESGRGVTSVDLIIRRGEYLGITGPSGSGKTTLLDLLAGIVDPQHGEITVDGRAGAMPRVGYAAQNADIFDDTLLVNITLAPGGAFDEGRIGEAIRAAGLEPFVASLPDGMATLLGSRGARISGGERQRIAIARALYRRPDLLVLDEPVASVDAATAAHILASIAALRGHATIVLASHEPDSLAVCDRIVELRAGRVAPGTTGQGFAGVTAAGVE